MFIARHIQRRDERFDVLDTEGRFRADAILCQKIVQRCAQELAIDQKLQRNRSFCFQESVHEGGELVAAEFYNELSAIL